MLLGVLSDTHGHVPFTQQAVRMLESLQVEVVLHCGDIGSPEVVALLEAWPTHFVLGNVDYDAELLEASMRALRLHYHGRCGRLEIAGRKLVFLHGDDGRKKQELIASGDWDLVAFGHTHVAEVRREGPTLALNPGAVYRANPRSVAVVDLADMQATIVPL